MQAIGLRGEGGNADLTGEVAVVTGAASGIGLAVSRRLGAATLDRFGAVHVVCNNAGVGGGGPGWDVPLPVWDWVLGANLFGVVHGIRAFLPHLLAQGEGHVVNTASVAGLTTPASTR